MSKPYLVNEQVKKGRRTSAIETYRRREENMVLLLKAHESHEDELREDLQTAERLLAEYRGNNHNRFFARMKVSSIYNEFGYDERLNQSLVCGGEYVALDYVAQLKRDIVEARKAAAGEAKP